uniref:Putative DNA binding, helix-turn-helix domain containing protein n=1 Tax=viral metagenome TaxID=1070528 RepID=A0A6M3L278_9ZZZZ
MKNVAIGDINLTINVSSQIVDNLHQVKNIVDKLAIAPPGSIPRRQISQDQTRLPLALAADDLNLEEVKARVVRMALAKHGWNRTHAAEELGVSVRGLRDWINKYGLKEV